MSTKKERIYIDTMVFLYHLYSVQHRLHPKSESFFRDIENQRITGITSSFTRSEYLGVIKELIPKDRNVLPDQAKINEALTIFDKFVDEMGIEYYDSDELAGGNLFSDSFIRISTSVPTQGTDKKWRSLNGADSLLLIFAERSGSDKIATNDDGFKRTASSVRPLILRETY